MRRLVLALAVPALLMAGCSSDDDGGTPAGERSDSSASSTDAAATYPACDDVWQAGQTLPDGYEGCQEGDSVVAAVYYECKTGGQYTSYDDALFALEGGPIVETVGDVADLRSDCDGTPRVPR